MNIESYLHNLSLLEYPAPCGDSYGLAVDTDDGFGGAEVGIDADRVLAATAAECQHSFGDIFDEYCGCTLLTCGEALMSMAEGHKLSYE